MELSNESAVFGVEGRRNTDFGGGVLPAGCSFLKPLIIITPYISAYVAT